MFVNQMRCFLVRHGAMSRKTTIFSLFILALCLTVPGLRTPWGAAISVRAGKPESRPRALLHAQGKICKQVVPSPAKTVTFIPHRVFIVNRPETTGFVCQFTAHGSFFTPLPRSQSRASPASIFPV